MYVQKEESVKQDDAKNSTKNKYPITLTGDDLDLEPFGPLLLVEPTIPLVLFEPLGPLGPLEEFMIPAVLFPPFGPLGPLVLA